MKSKMKTTAGVTCVMAAALLAGPAPNAEAVNCQAAGYPAGTGCLGAGHGITKEQARKNREMAKCLAGAGIAFIPAGRTGRAIASKLGGAAFTTWTSCNLKIITAK